jgi:hypothetical protein
VCNALGVLWVVRRRLAVALVLGITVLSVAGSHGVPALESAGAGHGAISVEELAAVCLGATVIAAVTVRLPGPPAASCRPTRGVRTPDDLLPSGPSLRPAAPFGPVVPEVLRL